MWKYRYALDMQIAMRLTHYVCWKCKFSYGKKLACLIIYFDKSLHVLCLTSIVCNFAFGGLMPSSSFLLYSCYKGVKQDIGDCRCMFNDYSSLKCCRTINNLMRISIDTLWDLTNNIGIFLPKKVKIQILIEPWPNVYKWNTNQKYK